MSSRAAETAPRGFDASALKRFLAANGPFTGQVEVERIAGGQSNPTYFVDVGADRLVLRKQPSGTLLASAHAIDREYRVLRALQGTGVPVPDAILYCDDRSIVGTPFYIMRRVDGRVFHDGALAKAAPGERRDMYRSVAVTLAQLHNVDPQAVGLSDFGRQGGYFARQISRWTRQWDATKQGDDPNIDRLIEWLPNNIPDDDLSVIAHGDFRLGNLMFHPSEPRVVAILDWELSTLGHPLADLAHCAMGWHCTPAEYGGIMGLDADASGLPSRSEFERWYRAEASRKDPLRPFHMAFALFRFAVIFEGIAARAKAGNAAGQNASDVGPLARVFSARAAEIAASRE